MLCPNCGAAVGDNVRLCDKCQAVQDEREREKLAAEAAQQESIEAEEKVIEEFIPAGFGLRLFAGLVDISFLAIFSIALTSSKVHLLLPAGLPGFIGMFGGWLYFAGCESSPLQGTFGKSLFGLDVTDKHGGKISFLRASGRYIGKFLFIVPFLLSLTATGALAFSSKTESAAIIFILGSALATLIALATYGAIFFTRHKQGLHDLASQTLVVRNIVHPSSRYALFAVFSVLLFAASVYFQAKLSGKMMTGAVPAAEIPSIVSTPKIPDLPPVVSTTLPPLPPLPRIKEPQSETTLPTVVEPKTSDGVLSSSAQPEPIIPAELLPSSSETGSSSSQAAMEVLPVDTGFGTVAVGEKEPTNISDHLAIYYAQQKRLEVAFYRNTLSERDRQRILQGQYLISPQVYTRPLVVMIVVFEDPAKGTQANNIKSYSLNFYRETAGSFTFPGFAHTAGIFRDKKTAKLSELPKLSGTLMDAGEVAGSMKGSDTVSSIRTKFKWDIHFKTKIVVK